LAYVVMNAGLPVGCLMFGRPESTRCYSGGLRYGSVQDVAMGRAQYTRWEVLNLARVWLDPIVQRGGERYVPNAATQAIGMALKRIGYDYLLAHPPVYVEEPYQIKICLSYCDTKIHTGTIYRAAGFSLARQAWNIQTWIRPLRPLRQAERKRIEILSVQSERGKRYRAARACRAETLSFIERGEV
jgi:hypothetical protein